MSATEAHMTGGKRKRRENREIAEREKAIYSGVYIDSGAVA